MGTVAFVEEYVFPFLKTLKEKAKTLLHTTPEYGKRCKANGNDTGFSVQQMTCNNLASTGLLIHPP